MIDLHTHTDQSDGTVPPAQLIHQAMAMGLEAIAITDHDLLTGYEMAAPVAAQEGFELICGVELSTRMPRKPGDPRHPSVHLLGYFVDSPPSPEFQEWLKKSQASRRQRNLDLIARLQSLGLDINLEEVQILGRNLTGRPHFARVLVRKGYAENTQQAFDLYLADDAKAAVDRDEPTLMDAVRRVRDGGGMPVLAHPVRLLARDRTSLEALLRELMDAGLLGLEVFHSEHSAEQTAMFQAIAEQFQLIVTGGSDFHGDNKPGISLGTGRGGNLNLPYAVLEGMRNASVSSVH